MGNPETPADKSEKPSDYFEELAAEFDRITSHARLPHEVREMPVFEEVVERDLSVVPRILRRLLESDEPNSFWCCALIDIINDDLVTPDGFAENSPESVEAWIEWGKEREYI